MRDHPGGGGDAGESRLFLDELGEISHLLRVLDQGEHQRLGEARRRSRFQLIGATNRPLESLKHDFPRHITLTGLEERPEDRAACPPPAGSALP